MRIAVHDFTGHAFQVQLSRELARRGHNVRHLYCPAFEGPKGPVTPRSSDPANLTIQAIGDSPYPKYSFVRRFFADCRYAKDWARDLDTFRPDVVLSGNCSPVIQTRLLDYCERRSVRFVYWLQDWYGMAAQTTFSAKWGTAGRLLGGYILEKERKAVRRSHQAVFISEDFVKVVPEKTRDIAVIENWAPLDELPLKPKRNSWSVRHGLADKNVFLYSGTLGLKHNADLLLALALRCRSIHNSIVVVLTQGLGRAHLERRRAELNLPTLKLLDYQPYEDLPEVIASGDVLLAILTQDAGEFSVPSKILTYISAARPILLSVPPSNLAARIVASNNIGVVVDPADSEGFLNAAEQLLSDRERARMLGERARHYALSHFDISEIATRFETVLRKAVNSGSHE